MTPWLAGEPAPDWFYDDGCSKAPDAIFGVNLKPLCRLHDYAYHEARILDWVVNGTYGIDHLGVRTRHNNGLKHAVKTAESDVDRNRLLGEIDVLTSKIMHIRTTADINLRTNIRTMFRVAGKPRRGKLVAWAYFNAVLKLGRKSMMKPGHPANFDRLRDAAEAYRLQLARQWRKEDRAA